jgi:hypothetical protein
MTSSWIYILGGTAAGAFVGFAIGMLIFYRRMKKIAKTYVKGGIIKDGRENKGTREERTLGKGQADSGTSKSVELPGDGSTDAERSSIQDESAPKPSVIKPKRRKTIRLHNPADSTVI